MEAFLEFLHACGSRVWIGKAAADCGRESERASHPPELRPVKLTATLLLSLLLRLRLPPAVTPQSENSQPIASTPPSTDHLAGQQHLILSCRRPPQLGQTASRPPTHPAGPEPSPAAERCLIDHMCSLHPSIPPSLHPSIHLSIRPPTRPPGARPLPTNPGTFFAWWPQWRRYRSGRKIRDGRGGKSRIKSTAAD